MSGADTYAGVAVAGQNEIGADVTGGFTTTVAVAYFVVSAALVARTVKVCLTVTDAGAVYSPAVEIEPTAEERDHVTEVLEVPVTLAVNCCLAPGPSVTVAGETATVTTGAGETLMTDVKLEELSDTEI